jgi:hypothetical protein
MISDLATAGRRRRIGEGRFSGTAGAGSLAPEVARRKAEPDSARRSGGTRLRSVSGNFVDKMDTENTMALIFWTIRRSPAAQGSGLPVQGRLQ